MPLENYKTFVFDCDGVLLNSNHVKTQAFYETALVYGEDAAKEFADYHVRHGGVSRYKKFEYFLTQIVPGQSGPDKDVLLETYASKVKESLLTCEITPHLRELREHTAEAGWMIVSGGDQQELQEVFAKRGFAELFDLGIFGSPDTKDAILSRELERGALRHPALFLGDSKYDYQAASAAGLDFIFIRDWSEVTDMDVFLTQQSIRSVANLSELVV